MVIRLVPALSIGGLAVALIDIVIAILAAVNRIEENTSWSTLVAVVLFQVSILTIVAIYCVYVTPSGENLETAGRLLFTPLAIFLVLLGLSGSYLYVGIACSSQSLPFTRGQSMCRHQ